MSSVATGIIGFFIGGFFGVTAMAICAASGNASRTEEGMLRNYTDAE